MDAEITREFTFEAAHHLPPVGPDHKCFRLHGHLFRVEVTVAGTVDPAMGWVMDFGDLARAGHEVLAALDHRVLNEVPGLEVPTSENLARWVFERAAARVPGVVAVTIHESPYSRCTFRPAAPAPVAGSIVAASGPDLLFSSAHFLVFPPDAREPLHGHDYRLRLEATVEQAGPDTAGVLAACGRRAIADLCHRVLLPARPAAGRLDHDGEEVRLTAGGATIALPAADCTLLDVPNTTTEALAGLVARRVAAMREAREAGVTRVHAILVEGADASARAFAPCLDS